MSEPSPHELTYRHPALEAPALPAPSRASLIIERGDELFGAALSEGASLVIGRASPADVVVDDRSLSRTHARFMLRAGAVIVDDLGSTNGVLLDGERVVHAVLEDGDGVTLGAVRVTVSGLGTRREASCVQGWSSFRTALEGELARATTFQRPCSLIALRAPNAPFGTLGPQLRAVDVVTQYTPDLALVLLPETPPTIAVEIARKLHARCGPSSVAAVVGFPEDAVDFETLIEAAVHAGRSSAVGSVRRVAPRELPNAAEVGAPVVVSEAMQRLYALVERMARATLPVLVQGETGAGKELVARAVHDRSARSKGPFVAINCASIAASLVESVLFGHEKGAFTGASERRAGVFEQAIGGSVFLDEVGELSPAVQAALLRVLETKRLTRVGSTKEIEVDVRVIAATHRDLSSMVSAGTFREDLMFRLDALSLRVPPLRERVEEIEPLAERFLAQARTQWNAPARAISDEARAALRRYRWPGNVRQLKNVIERASVVCAGEVIGLDELPSALLEVDAREPLSPEPIRPAPARAPESADLPAQDDPNRPYEDRVRAFEARVIGAALAQTRGNHTKAAALLQMPRRTLTNKVHALGLACGDGAARGPAWMKLP